MKKLLLSVLENFCPDNVYLQGTLNPDESYPDTFLTYWTPATDDNTHYDNETFSVDWHFTIILYSIDAETVNTLPLDILAALKKAGFIPQGRGRDIPSDRPTHTGWAMDVIFKEILQK